MLKTAAPSPFAATPQLHLSHPHISDGSLAQFALRLPIIRKWYYYYSSYDKPEYQQAVVADPKMRATFAASLAIYTFYRAMVAALGSHARPLRLCQRLL